MQNEFDNTIKKQVDDFKLKPSPQIWERVEAQLSEKKRRRFAFWWWLPALIILFGIGFYELGLQHNKLKTNINTDKAELNKASLIKEKDINGNSIKTNKDQLKNSNIIASKNKSNSNRIKREKPFEFIIGTNKNPLTDSTLAGIIKLINPITNNNQNNLYNGNLYNNKGHQIANDTDDLIKINSNLDSTTNNKNFNKNIDSTIVADIKNDSAKLKKDTVLSITKNVIKTNKTFKVKWELTASIGSSNTVGQAFSNGASSNYNLANSITSPTSNPQPQTSSLSIPNAGISFAVGIQRTQQINKNWSWYGSFQYTYLSNHQASDAFVDSSLTLGNGQSNVSNYYKYGNTVEHLNQIHRFDVFAGFKYTFNTNSSKLFSLYGGLVLGYQFSNNWLQADAQQPVLFYSNTLTTKLITGSRFGLDWQLGNQFSAGAFYEFAFTNTSRSVSQYYLHWQIFGAKISVPFTCNKTKPIVHH